MIWQSVGKRVLLNELAERFPRQHCRFQWRPSVINKCDCRRALQAVEDIISQLELRMHPISVFLSLVIMAFASVSQAAATPPTRPFAMTGNVQRLRVNVWNEMCPPG